jgi:hypothetical protein
MAKKTNELAKHGASKREASLQRSAKASAALGRPRRRSPASGPIHAQVTGKILINGQIQEITATQHQNTPFEWDKRYACIPESTWDDWDLNEVPVEAFRLLRRLWRDLTRADNIVPITTFKELGASLHKPLSASRTSHMLAWLEENKYLLRIRMAVVHPETKERTVINQIFLSPIKTFGGGGTKHADIMEKWYSLLSIRTKRAHTFKPKPRSRVKTEIDLHEEANTKIISFSDIKIQGAG